MQISLSRRCILKYLFRTKVTWSPDIIKTNLKAAEKRLDLLPLCSQVLYGKEICIQDYSGRYTYSLLHYKSKVLSRQISNICGSQSSSTVGIFCSHNVLTILITWASWMSGQKVLFLDRGLPFQQLRSLAKESSVRLIISSDLLEKQSKQLAYENDVPLIYVDFKFLCNDSKQEILDSNESAIFDHEALIYYSKDNSTKRTVNHGKLCAKVQQALQSWPLTVNDIILYMCPSFHQYSEEFIFNLYFPLSAGSQLNIFDPVDSKAAWQTILGINIPSKNRVSVLIAEPKIYQQLIEEYEKMFAGDKKLEEHIRLYCLQNIRFMLSCFYSADQNMLSSWYNITGTYLQQTNFSIENTDRQIEEANYIASGESESTENGRFPILHISIIGRLVILNQDDLFFHSGEIESYCNGYLKTIGRYYRYSSC